MIFIPSTFTGREVVLYLVVGLGGSLLLRTMVGFPYYLSPIAFCVVYSVVAELLRDEEANEISPPD